MERDLKIRSRKKQMQKLRMCVCLEKERQQHMLTVFKYLERQHAGQE